VRSPFLRRSTPFRALKRLIGFVENVVNQASGGFKRFWEAQARLLSGAQKNQNPLNPSGFYALLGLSNETENIVVSHMYQGGAVLLICDGVS